MGGGRPGGCRAPTSANKVSPPWRRQIGQTLIVLRDLDSICERRVLWRAVLSGGWLLSDGAARGDQGIFVKFRAAVAKAQRVGCGAVWRGGAAETF